MAHPDAQKLELGKKEAAVSVVRKDGITSEKTSEGNINKRQYESSSAHNNTERRSDTKQRPWLTSFLRFGPLSGILGMVLAFSSIVACLGILAGSNNRDIDGWPTPPNTWLAIFTAIANLSMRYAAIQGIVITWWTRALKGSDLAKLHYDWRAASS